MESNSGLMDEAIVRLLELSADAHIQRRGATKDSPEFDNLTVAISAYGKVLALLIALRHQEEFDAITGHNEFSKSVAAVS
jgi:hypothetical protein